VEHNGLRRGFIILSGLPIFILVLGMKIYWAVVESIFEFYDFIREYW
jgi:hypothetical protein